MKIRSDFVTNSSSSSFMAIKGKNKRLMKFLTLCDEEDSDDGFFVKSEEDNTFDFYAIVGDENIKPTATEFVGDLGESISEYLVWLSNLYGEEDEDISESEDMESFTDANFKMLEINHTEFDDGTFGPFEYIKINKKKKLTIYVEYDWNDNAYKNEDIDGMEFFLIGKKNEFSRCDDIIAYITENGGLLSEKITDQTRYAVCADFEKNASKVSKARNACIPVLSEDAFAFRYLDETPYEDIYDIASNLNPLYGSEYSEDDSVRSFFEKYGYGDTSLERWDDGEWVMI